MDHIRARIGGAGVALLGLGGAAHAHASEQALVLLLPTEVYRTAGFLAVALSVVVTFIVSDRMMARLYPKVECCSPSAPKWPSVLTLAGMFALLWIGVRGSTDPLKNLLPLMVWTAAFIGLPLVQVCFGDLWRVFNPWVGLYRLLRIAPLARLAPRLGYWPAVVLFLLFNAFALADPAPDQPARLMIFVAAYWLVTFSMVMIFGEDWVKRGEFFGVFLRLFAGLSPFGRGGAGLPGWRLIRGPASVSLAVFSIFMLGSGSFDGLNETFWWLAQIRVNPLEFPGRSAIIGQTLGGLIGANLLLVVVFSMAVWVGWRMAKGQGFALFFTGMALALLPIALGYHIAHFLTALLINGQYLLVALSDPFARGDDWLNLGEHFVTTGFFNQTGTVRVIFLTQAGAVVLGHILAILMSHAIAIRHFETRRAALISQIPMTLFMLAYTFLGLWLLAAARGA